MRTITKGVALAVALAFAVPAFAGDASDTYTEKKADARKTARDLKPGGKDAGDRMEDAKDTASAKAAQGRKKARHAKKKTKKKADQATQ